MSVLGEVMAATTMVGGVRLVVGTTVRDNAGRLVVGVQGVTVEAAWLGTMHAMAGMTVLVALVGAGEGQSSAIVLGPLVDRPRTTMCVVRSVAGDTAVAVIDGEARTCAWVGTAPRTGLPARLMWQGAEPVILGTGKSLAVDVPGGTVEPSQSVMEAPAGRATLRATGSGSWTPDGIRWTGSVVQGTGDGQTDIVGGWGYGAALTAMAGLRVTAAHLHLDGRTGSGAHDQPVTLRVAAHAQTHLLTRPQAVGSSWEVQVPARGSDWPVDVEVPVATAQWLVDHAGGLMLHGPVYGGVTGVGDAPMSGCLTIDWTR